MDNAEKLATYGIQEKRR